MPRARGPRPRRGSQAKKNKNAKLTDEEREKQGRDLKSEKALLAVKEVKMRGKGLPRGPQQRVRDVEV